MKYKILLGVVLSISGLMYLFALPSIGDIWYISWFFVPLVLLTIDIAVIFVRIRHRWIHVIASKPLDAYLFIAACYALPLVTMEEVLPASLFFMALLIYPTFKTVKVFTTSEDDYLLWD